MTAPSLAASVARARQTLIEAGLPTEDATRDAALLARWVLGWNSAEWLVRSREPEPTGFAHRFLPLVTRRAAREPVAYLTGAREFYGRDFAVTCDVLIPRVETELVIQEALRCLGGPPPHETPRPPLIADVGTGSGCLAVTLALECPGARVVATDVSAAALRVATANATRLGVSGQVEFRQGALLAGAPGPFTLIAANPPYVAEADRAALPREVIEYEPELALFAGPDGLGVIRDLLPVAAGSLAPGGWLVLEIGQGEDEPVLRLIDRTPGLAIDRIARDLQGIARVLAARRQT